MKINTSISNLIAYRIWNINTFWFQFLIRISSTFIIYPENQWFIWSQFNWLTRQWLSKQQHPAFIVSLQTSITEPVHTKSQSWVKSIWKRNQISCRNLNNSKMRHFTMDHNFNNSKKNTSLLYLKHLSFVLHFFSRKSQASWNRHTNTMSKKLKLGQFRLKLVIFSFGESKIHKHSYT